MQGAGVNGTMRLVIVTDDKINLLTSEVEGESKMCLSV